MVIQRNEPLGHLSPIKESSLGAYADLEPRAVAAFGEARGRRRDMNKLKQHIKH